MKRQITLGIAVAGITLAAHAQTERDLDSHEHGAATLNIALDANTVLVELESPWNNILGFEHTPSSEEQKNQYADALTLLDKPDQLFSFSGTDCTVSDIYLEDTLADSDHDDHDKDDDHDDDHDEHHDDHDKDGDHDEHHDDHDKDGDHDEHHDDHDKDGDHGEHDEHDHDETAGKHSGVLVAYSFECADAKQLSTINVDLFKSWSGFEKIAVQYIGPGGQASTTLDSDNSQIDVTPIRRLLEVRGSSCKVHLARARQRFSVSLRQFYHRKRDLLLLMAKTSNHFEAGNETNFELIELVSFFSNSICFLSYRFATMFNCRVDFQS